jgi:hypothetical protein
MTNEREYRRKIKVLLEIYLQYLCRIIPNLAIPMLGMRFRNAAYIELS